MDVAEALPNPQRVLITGGAGFIGSHTADAMVERGHRVTVLDVLDPEVHGGLQEAPSYLSPSARFVMADIRDESLVASLVEASDVVFHLAANTSAAHSMYQPRRYFDVNVGGTAVLLEAIQRQGARLARLVVASSRAVYGEGAYSCASCETVTPGARSPEKLAASEWEPDCPRCGGPLTAVPTSEAAALQPTSVYGVTKLAQEQACLMAGAAHGIPVVALRYFNVFGPRQSLLNPYTGVISAFVNRVRAGGAPEVYEDGHESRDFVHIADVVRANVAAMEHDEAVGQAINVGSGERVSLLDVAKAVSEVMEGAPPQVTGMSRVGDVRHGFADISLAGETLGYRPSVRFHAGLRTHVEEIVDDYGEDRSAAADAELRAWGLISGGSG